MLKISKKINTEQCLFEVAEQLGVLDRADAARTDKSHSINMSARQVFNEWFQGYHDKREAFDTLYTALCKAGHGSLTNEIRYVDKKSNA